MSLGYQERENGDIADDAEEHGRERRVNFQAWQCSFLLGLFLLIAVVPAHSQEVPVLNVEPVCRGIAQQASDPSEKGAPDLAFPNA